MLGAVYRHTRAIDPVQILFERQRGMMKPHFLNPSPFCGVMDVVAHDFDQVLWQMGRVPQAVTAVVRRNTFTDGTDAADTCSGPVDFGDGRGGVVFSSIGAPNVGTRFDFIGAEGNLSFGSRQELSACRFPRCTVNDREQVTLEPAEESDPDVALQTAFAEEIRTGTRSCAARPRDGLHSLLVTLACLQSAREGRRVSLDQVDA